MRSFYLLFLFALILPAAGEAQVIVTSGDMASSHYEESLNKKGSLVAEDAREIWRYKNLRIAAVVQKDQSQHVIASALRVGSKRADGRIDVVSDEVYGYLDHDELDSLISSLEIFAASFPGKPYFSEKTMTYSARGNVYAGCYLKNYTWRVILTSVTWDEYYHTSFTPRKLNELINVLKQYKKEVKAGNP